MKCSPGCVSEHLHPRLYQVATSTDPDLPFRKWNQRGSHYAVSHRSAAFRFLHGDPSAEFTVQHLPGVVYECAGLFVHVGFGWRS